MFWGSDLQDWHNWNGRQSGKTTSHGASFFLLLSKTIWKRRNSIVFWNNTCNSDLPREIVNQAIEYTHYVSSPRMSKQRVVKRICWEKPPEGWMKLNTDGSAIGNPSPAGCGGAIRDNNGQWIARFTKRNGIVSVSQRNCGL